MGLVSLFAVVALAAMVAWVIGSIVLRAVGMMLIVAGLFVTVSVPDVVGLLVMLTLGLSAWLAGHWLYAFRHHAYAGPLVERIFLQWLPKRLDPMRNWL